MDVFHRPVDHRDHGWGAALDQYMHCPGRIDWLASDHGVVRLDDLLDFYSEAAAPARHAFVTSGHRSAYPFSVDSLAILWHR